MLDTSTQDLKSWTVWAKQAVDDITDRIVDWMNALASLQITVNNKHINSNKKSPDNDKAKQLQEHIKEKNLDTECFLNRYN